MKEYRILSLVGKDRPGIVDDVSAFLFDRGANIEDSRMAYMGGCFSVMMLFSCESSQLEAIGKDLDELRKLDFQAFLHEARDPTTTPARQESPFKTEVTAMDHPGIVRKLVRLLRSYDVNIVSLTTEVLRAPHFGTPLFDLELEAAMPSGKPMAGLKDDLAALAEDLDLDLAFLR